MSAKRLLEVADAELCVETFGDPADPALLLIGGTYAPMDWWDDGFCRELSGGGRFVIRYDHRDTGQSTSYPVGKPGYTSGELASDAIGVLDAIGLDRAHLVGISMGAAIAQRLAVKRPERVSSLTLLSTTPIDDVERKLPAIGAGLTEQPAEPDWTDHEAVIEYIVAVERAYEGPDVFDEQAVRELANRVVGRTRDLAAAYTNHMAADDDAEAVDLGAIGVPTLVVHGTADPLFAIAHGEALAEAIDGAELLVLDGVGHQAPPPSTWPVVVSAILRVSGG